MKRTIVLILSVMFILCSCGGQTPQTTDAPDTVPPLETTEAAEPTLPPPVLTGDEDTFSLSYLPDIGVYEGEKAPERWYADYAGELIPSEDYGELIPYLGYIQEFDDFAYGEWRVRKQYYYGLCTTDGVVVTDPVYSAVYIGEEGYYILRGQPEWVELEYYTDYLYPFYIAKCDGSSVVRLSSYAAVCQHFTEDVYCTRESYVDESGWKMHTREGEVLLEYGQDGYYTGIPILNADGTIICAGKGTQYFVNNRFECTSAVFKSIKYIGDSLYIVEELAGGYGIIDVNGEYIVPSEYDMLVKREGGYVSLKGSTVEVKDEGMNTLHSFEADHAVKEISAVGPSVICVRGEEKMWDNHYYSLDGKEYEYENVSFTDMERKYYFFSGDERTLITDLELNEIVCFERGGLRAEYYTSPVDGYIALRDLDAQGPDLLLYDIAEGDITEGISRVYGDYYTVESADGTVAYYDYEGNSIPPREETVTYIDEQSSTMTPCGELYFYMDGDYACTADSDGNIIVKRRAEFD